MATQLIDTVMAEDRSREKTVVCHTERRPLIKESDSDDSSAVVVGPVVRRKPRRAVRQTKNYSSMEQPPPLDGQEASTGAHIKSTPEEETVGEGEEGERGPPPLGFQRLVLHMKKRANSGLGVTVVHSPGKTKGIFMVRRIMAGGVAARDKRVRTGDRLVAINKKSLLNLSHAEVLQTISEAPKEIRLEIWRDPDFEFDASSSIYSIGSRSSILSDEDTEDSLSKRHSLHSLERFARDGGGGGGRRARASPRIARYSASMVADYTMGGLGASPGTPKRWSTVVLSPNVGPAGEVLSSSPPPPPSTSPTHTFAPAPSPNTLTPSPVPSSPAHSSPEPDTSPHHPPHPSFTPPPSPPPFPLPSRHSDSDGSQTPPPPPSPSSYPPPPPPPSSHPPVPSDHHHMQESTEGLPREDEDSLFKLEDVTVRGLEKREVERPKSLGPVPKGTRLEHGPFEIEITRGIFGLGLSVRMGKVGMIVIESLTSRSPIKKDGNIRYIYIHT